MFPFAKRRYSRKPNKRRRRPSCQYNLETLEDRTLPAVDFASVDFSAAHNVRVHDLQPACAGLPAGDVVLGGVPFSIPTTGANIWWGYLAQGLPPRVLDIPVGTTGVDEVHTLINSSWGQPGPGSLAAVEFYGTNGAFYRKDLIGDADLRDHFWAYWTNSINNTTTTNVAQSGSGFFNECRLDKQRIDLPDNFLTETLTTIRIIDSGAFGVQHVMLTGVTVGVRSLPDLVATALTLDRARGGVNLSYQVANAPLTQDATVALYWATGPNLADRVGEPVYRATAEKAVGTYGPYHVSAEALDAYPGATNLLLVVDAGDAVAEADELNNVRALVVPPSDIALLDATTRDFRTISLHYAVANWAAAAFSFRAYLSNDARFDSGVDTPLQGELHVTDLELRRPNADGSPRHYPAAGLPAPTLKLSARAPVKDNVRFVLVVADADNVAEPEGALLRGNNVSYVVPLFGPGERINRLGQKGVVHGKAEERNKTKGSGPTTGAILRGTEDFTRLKSLAGQWDASSAFVFGLQNERQPWQREEDTLVQESLLDPLDRLAKLLRAELDNPAGVWGETRLSIDEAYDSTGVHGRNSLHKEGRAVDLSVLPGSGGVNPSRPGRLAGLTWLAGFDWVQLENSGQVHASERAAFVTTIDQHSLQDAVREGVDLGLIERENVANRLRSKLDGLDRLLAQGRIFAALHMLHAFRDAVQEQRCRGNIDPALAKQLVRNVDILVNRLWVSYRGWCGR